MSLSKHSSFVVLSAKVAQAGGGPLMKNAHRHEFEYTPQPGYLYVRSRMISSRCNDNFDEFPADEIKQAHLSFIGKPVFVNHSNSNHRRARGVIKAVALHEDVNPDGTQDTWVEGLMEVDAIRFPLLAKAIIAKHIDRTSMGTDVAYSLCSFCGNKASNPTEYCKHIPKMKGQRIYRTTASGEKEGILVREVCYGLHFFENSLLVEEPADPTAYFLGVDDHSGLSLAASKTAARGGQGGSTIGPWRKDKATRDQISRQQDERRGWVFSVGGYTCNTCALELPRPPEASYLDDDDVYQAKLEAIRASLAKMDAHVKTHKTAKTASTYEYDVSLSCGDTVAYVGSQSGQVAAGQPWNCSQHGDQEVVAVSGQGTTDKGLGLDHFGRKTASRTAGNERVVAPADVDTLRDEACPVCQEADSYDGEKCQVCGFIKPPDEFGDPDLEKAKQTDLRQQADDGLNKGGDLECDNCGETFSSGAAPIPKQAVILDMDKDQSDASEPTADVQAKIGDACPSCGEGTLQPSAQSPLGDEAADDGFAPAGSASEDDSDDADVPGEADGEDGEDGDKPDFLKKKKDDSSKKDDPSKKKDDEDDKKSFPPKKKPTAARRRVTHVEGADVDMRPALAALAAQQKQIVALQKGLAFIADLAGVKDHPRVAAALKTAVDENPAFGGGWENGAPVEGAPEAPTETTEQAAAPTAKDDVESIGAGPLTDVAPDATTSLDDTGTTLETPLDLNEQDVTAPVAGTEDLGQGGRGQEGTNRIETEVRVGDGTQDKAFTDGGFLGSNRTIAGLRLARLRIQAGIEAGDDLVIGERIASDERISNEALHVEITTLSKVVASSGQLRTVPRSLVPQNARQAQRTMPSVAADPLLPEMSMVASVDNSEFMFE